MELNVGPLFAILATMSAGLTDASIRRGVQGIPAFVGLHITIFLGIPLLIIASTLTGQIFDMSNMSKQGYILLVGAGLKSLGLALGLSGA